MRKFKFATKPGGRREIHMYRATAMSRLAIWLFAFSPLLLALIPAARDRWGVGISFITGFTVVIAIVLERIVMKRRGATGDPSTPLGNWFAKAFGVLFVVAIVVLVIATQG
jgi:hypothetical protein